MQVLPNAGGVFVKDFLTLKFSDIFPCFRTSCHYFVLYLSSYIYIRTGKWSIVTTQDFGNFEFYLSESGKTFNFEES
jgi:hypothetical protein